MKNELKMAAALLAGGALFAVGGCVVVDSDEMVMDTRPVISHYSPDVVAEGATLPFSKAVKVGQTIYLSGELGLDYSTTTLVPGGVGPQTTQIFVNMANTLDAFGADLSDLVKCTVFLDDMAQFQDMNAAYTAALPDPKPARSTLGADGLALGAALEIECIAVIGRAR
ncbi:MAG: Rid family hydrolase [Henriciella sp.]|uniref:RidA family protein n=1 Tax=Henriciella sp. TaxID=1968823 RepID=UPI003C783403